MSDGVVYSLCVDVTVKYKCRMIRLGKHKVAWTCFKNAGQ